MSEPLQVSFRLPWEVQGPLLEELRKIVPDLEGGAVIQASQGPTSEWVELIATLITWHSVFKAAVLAYFGTLAKEAAKTTWASRHKGYKAVASAATGSGNAIRAVYQAVQRCSANRVPIGVVLKVAPPDEAVKVSPNSLNEDAFEMDFATFIVALDSIQHSVSHLHAKGHSPTFGDFDCKLKLDGLTLTWIEIIDSRNSLWELDFDADGNPLGEPKKIQ